MAASTNTAPTVVAEFNIIELEEFQLDLDITPITSSDETRPRVQHGGQFTAHVSATIPIPSNPSRATQHTNPVVIFNNGFQIDSGQYLTYAHGLAKQGYLTLRYHIDRDYPWPAIHHQDLADCLLRLMQIVGESEQLTTHWPPGPNRFILVGHSRGGKLAILAACRLAEFGIPEIHVEALILLDPVDLMDPSAADQMPQLQARFPPMLILGAELAKKKRALLFFAPACAPEYHNYNVLYNKARDVLGGEAVKKLVQCMVLKDTGHLQFLDKRGELRLASLCVSGSIEDSQVRAITMDLIISFLADFVYHHADNLFGVTLQRYLDFLDLIS